MMNRRRVIATAAATAAAGPVAGALAGDNSERDRLIERHNACYVAALDMNETLTDDERVAAWDKDREALAGVDR